MLSMRKRNGPTGIRRVTLGVLLALGTLGATGLSADDQAKIEAASRHAAIVKASKIPAAAQDYLNFLFSAQAKAAFEKYGFTVATP